ncbi:T cell receptor alpha chain MC.7.G5-like [Harpia harpyja]|uniref:T cell receptor alpha chain MC.7.G5-like n=1 Tax=Harpia harpyja TaxID=202280 RepID=UPI0022B11841|nr:T cell receptor alpha chain MC.7.G5-like [Harpia harpyja]
MRRCRGAGLAALAAVLLVAVVRAQVQQEASAETTEGTGISINCSHPNIQTSDSILWYRQLPGRGPAFLVSTLKGSKELPDPPGRLSVAADRRSSALWLARPRRGDAAVYYCALRGAARLGLPPVPLVFGSGTTLTVEPKNQNSSDPQVIVMKSKNLEGDGSIGKAACLAKNFNTKTISLEMSSNEVVYEQSTSILTSVGLYDTIKVVNVTKDTELTCTAHFNGFTITANATLPEKEAEEPVTGKVCNTTDTSAQDTKVEKANMLSMAVLGLRVLLAKSIAFNTLMSIKLFLS